MLWNKGDRDYKQCWTELRQCLVPELWCHFLLQTPVAGSHPDRVELSDQLPLDHTAHPLPGNPEVVLPPLSELKMCLSIDSTNTKGTPSPVLRKLTSVLFLYEEFYKMYSNVDVLRNFISNLPLFGNILNVFDRFNRFTPT